MALGWPQFQAAYAACQSLLPAPTPGQAQQIDQQNLWELDRQIEELSTNGLRFARDHDFDEAGLSALRLAIDEARRAINDQCNELQEKSALIANAASMRSLPYPASPPASSPEIPS